MEKTFLKLSSPMQYNHKLKKKLFDNNTIFANVLKKTKFPIGDALIVIDMILLYFFVYWLYIKTKQFQMLLTIYKFWVNTYVNIVTLNLTSNEIINKVTLNIYTIALTWLKT